ncbi:restriction endonuclease subunit S [Priestia megaterium]|uniref:restriction endonuclease subunit S n=1 Tax=Priestia megaterium TaxID=1404 RepID=UPI00310124D9
MSKKKKSIEELLEKTLIQEEQPYEIPGNWLWVKLDSLSKVISKGTTPPKSKGHDYTDEGVNFLRVENITKNQTLDINNVKFISENTHSTVLNRSIGEENDVLISIAGALGRVAIIRKEHLPCNMNQAIAFVRLCGEYVNADYIKYAISSPVIQRNLLQQKRITAQPNLNLKNIGDILIPLPPLNEQKLIVKKVEHLLNKIEDVKQLIEEAKETFELRRAAIIQTVLREGLKGDELPAGWKSVKIEKLFNIFGGGTPSKTKQEYWNGDIPWISAKDMKTSYISNTMDYITNEGLGNSSAKLAKKGSIAMVVRSGILQRTLPVAYLLTECTVNQDLKVFDSGDELINKYFMWYIKGNEKSLLQNYSKSGTTVNSIEFQKFKSHELILPSMEILKKKVDRIENAIEKETKAKEILNLVEAIEQLKSSILSKAFRGELGTNDSSEESAIELLKEVLQEQVK